MAENANENAERPRLGLAQEHTLGDFADKLRRTAGILRDEVHPFPTREQLSAMLTEAAQLIDNMRPAALWLRQQPRHQHSECSDYSVAQVVDLLERFARESQKG